MSSLNEIRKINFFFFFFSFFIFFSFLFLATTTKTTSRVFTLGTKFDFVSTATKNSDNWIIELAQQNQLYQVIVDKRQATDSLTSAVSEILRSGPFFGAKDVYFDFLEKWGTHYVISAVIGGSVEMTAAVEKQGETSSVSTIANISFALNTTTTTNSSTETEIENFIANAPECARIGKKGWILNKAETEKAGTTVCEGIHDIY